MAIAASRTTKLETRCGHTAAGNGFTYSCDLPIGHKGWHEKRTKLRSSKPPYGPMVEYTNWGDDGLAMHASKDQKRREESGR